MPITAPENRLYVVVGIIENADGDILVQQRLPGKPCAGQWEFPGGKLESHETPEQALSRELQEELGIRVNAMHPFIQIGYDYAHANVWLDIYQITNYQGDVLSREGQALQWLSIEQIRELDLLDAVPPILDALQTPSH